MSQMHPYPAVEPSVLARSLARICLILLLVLGVVISAAIPAAATQDAPAPAATDAESDTQADESAQQTVSLVITPELPVLPADASEYVFFATVNNISAEKIPETALSLSVDTSRVAAISNADPQPNPGAAQLLSQTQVGSLAAGESKELRITVAAADFPLTADSAAGVYTLTASMHPGQGDVSETLASVIVTAEPTYFTWQGLPAENSTAVTFVIPLLLPTNINVMPSRAQLADELPRLQALLDSARGSNATLAVDPRILAGIRAYGTAAPASAITFLESLITANLSMFSLQFNDADPSAQAALGATELLAPLGFEFVTQNGTFPSDTQNLNGDQPSTETEPASPSSNDAAENTPDPAAAVPNDAELLALPKGYAGAWPAPGQVDQQTLDLLRSSGLTSLVLDETNVSPVSSPKIDMSGFTALVSNTQLVELSTEWLKARTAADRSRAASQMLARIAAPHNGAQANVVLAFDRGSAASSNEIPELISLLLAQPGVTSGSEQAIPVSPASLLSTAPLETRVETLRSLTAASDQVNALSPLLETPKFLLEYERIRLMAAYATRHAAPTVDFETVADRMMDRTNELLLGVAPVSTTTTQLIGVSSEVPVTLHNNLPFDARVTVHVTAGSATIQLDNQESSVIAVPAQGNALYLVAVNSRVSSGESQLFIEVQDKDRQVSYSTLEMQLTLRSAYETVLLTVLAVSAVTLLAAGIWRSVRRRKKSKQHKLSVNPEFTE